MDTPDTQVERRRPSRARTYDTDRVVVTPRVDVYENTDEILLLADVPGARDDGVRLNLEKEELTLEATCRVDGETERSFDYRRVFLVPKGVDADRVTAELKNGVLTVRLPKQEQLKPRRIQVNAG